MGLTSKMSFMDAMDMLTIGVNGATVLTEEGVGNKCLTLFTMLNRNLASTYIDRTVKDVALNGEADSMRDLWIMAFQTRDVRGGKGERDLFTHFFRSLCAHDRETAIRMLPLVPHYGCWRDLWALYRSDCHVESEILALVVAQYNKDLKHYRNDQPEQLSLLAKWLPREKSNRPMARILARAMFPEETSARRQLILYRMMVSAMNKDVKTVEVNQCAHSWGDIPPKRIPGRSFKKYNRALLNLPRKDTTPAADADALRYPNDPDRMACRENVIAFLEEVKAGKAQIHGAHVVMPHELVLQVQRTRQKEEQEVIQAQWNAIVQTCKERGGLGKSVAMCDFSGSMNGIPHQISLALGILISEITHPAFRDRILAFDAEPRWHAFPKDATLYEKIHSTRGVGQGLNTDFYKACRCILDAMVAARLPVGEEPEDLIVITDMGFDSASTQQTHYDRLSSNDQPPWGGQIQQIRDEFQREGERMWGQGWKPPRIVIWNVRAEYKDFHATAEQEGVVQLSGWSPSILKALQTGITVQTPLEGMRAILDDPRYDAVRECLAREDAS